MHRMARDLTEGFPCRIFRVIHENDLRAAGDKLCHPLLRYVVRNSGHQYAITLGER